jgi:hypothetical protein
MRVFGDILDFLRKSILRDTEDNPYLWGDDTLCECISQAHDVFAERTLCIRDATSVAASVQLVEGTSLYPAHPAVLAVLSAKLEGAEGNLVRASSSALDGYVPPPDVVQWLEAVNYGATRQGTPEVYTTDDSVDGADGAVAVRVWPTPTLADDTRTLLLRVVRLPLIQCSVDTLEERPECPRQSLMGLAHGAAAIAYGLHDSDGGDDLRATKQQEMFERYIEDAKRAARHKMFAPLSWGFGRGGFTHSR